MWGKWIVASSYFILALCFGAGGFRPPQPGGPRPAGGGFGGPPLPGGAVRAGPGGYGGPPPSPGSGTPDAALGGGGYYGQHPQQQAPPQHGGMRPPPAFGMAGRPPPFGAPPAGPPGGRDLLASPPTHLITVAAPCRTVFASVVAAAAGCGCI